MQQRFSSQERPEQEYINNTSYDGIYASTSHAEQRYYDQAERSSQQGAPPVQGTEYSHFILPGASITLLASMCYAGFWLTGLLFLLFVRTNRFIRFHAVQSLLFFGSVNLAYVVFFALVHYHMNFLYPVAILAFMLINIVAFVAWIVGMVGALQGRFVKLPFVGDLAERIVNNNSAVK